MEKTACLLMVVMCAVAVNGVTCASSAAEWPFAILRSYGSYEKNRIFFDRVFAAQERHPGLVEEIWFCGDGDPFLDAEAYGREVVKSNIGAKERCRELNIAFSYQEGVTLNHNSDELPHPGIPDDAWAVDRCGKVRRGILCCTSPFAIDFSYRKAKGVLQGLKPSSYWPDDDLRITKTELQGAAICFCDRCLELFGRRVGRAFTREELWKALEGSQASAELRRAWCLFNGAMLANFAAAYRRAVDEVSPSTRLGIQATCAFHALNGDFYRRIIPLFAGQGGRSGIRPGGGYYSDLDDTSGKMLPKMFMTGYESARSVRCPQTGQICYEVENWPHVGAMKNAGGMMSECALAIAFGCDSLAFYWGADQNGEDPASYDFWLETLAKWKPFLFAEREAFRGTFQGGLAAAIGSGHYATPDWLFLENPAIVNLARNALPVSNEMAEPDAYLLTERSVRALTTNDFARIFSKAVLISPLDFAALAQKFPSFGFTKKVRLESIDRERNMTTILRACYERFRKFGVCQNVMARIYPQSADVTALSEMTADPKACGTCVIPTEFGGRVVIAQDTAGKFPHPTWPGCRRHAILDALDLAVPGGMPARVLTDGYACVVSARKGSDGRTAGVFVLNLGTGETPPLELAVRRPRAACLHVRTVEGERPAEVVRTSSDEIVVRLPSLAASQPVFVVARE